MKAKLRRRQYTDTSERLAQLGTQHQLLDRTMQAPYKSSPNTCKTLVRSMRRRPINALLTLILQEHMRSNMAPKYKRRYYRPQVMPRTRTIQYGVGAQKADYSSYSEAVLIGIAPCNEQLQPRQLKPNYLPSLIYAPGCTGGVE